MTTSQNPTYDDPFTIGEKVFWVSPTGYKELVTVSGRVTAGRKIIKVQSMYGLMMDFHERNGQWVGVEHWGHLEKQPVVPAPAKSSRWTRIKNFFH